MSSPFIEIGDLSSLDQFLAEANGSAAILFKHSNTCGVSARAFREMSGLSHPVGLITVQQARDVSNEIEKRWQVAHETPQVLIIRDSNVIWRASHFQVKAGDVEAALA
jgi:bacillithiol system protein YtxJ